jgi:multiple sugar transport system permease protein
MALAVAMIMTKKTKVTGFYRAVYYLPSIIGGSVAVAVMWKQMFSSDGVINSLLQALGFDVTISWIGNKNTAIWVLILLAVWQFGSSMLIFLAGLKQIPKSYYEAATVDGASPVKSFFSITLPLLTPTIFFNLVMQTINGFMVFNSGYIITGGKPLNSTLFYALYLYQKAFTDYDMGYACAMAWVLLAVISVITALVFATSKRWVYYESER